MESQEASASQNKTTDPAASSKKKSKLHSCLKYLAIAVVILVILGILGKAAQKEDTQNSKSNTEDSGPSEDNQTEPTSDKLIIGLEYAFPGTEETFSELGIRGIKFYPEQYYAWGEMQSSPDKEIDFSKLDDMVTRYQENGMTEVTVGLRYDAKWAARDGGKFLNRENGIPKEEYQDEYETWLRAFVERYDNDGKEDMPGLRAPLRHYEVGVEYSSYVPEPSDQYVQHLERTYKVAHEAYPDVKISHAAILATNVFAKNPSEKEYKNAFDTKIPKGGTNKKYNDIVAILDRPDIFDTFNIHALEDPHEMDELFVWARYEMKKRGYSKPIIISDTLPSMYVGWGRANTCSGPLQGTLLYPAKEEDRCKIAEYFTKLIDNDKESLNFARAFVAEDLAKKVIIAAAQGAELINTAYTEDIEILKGLTGVGSGFGGWAGIVDVNRNARTNERTVKGKFPAFYALKQVQAHLKDFDSIKRVETKDTRVRIYELKDGTTTTWVAWHDPQTAYVAGEPTPTLETALPGTSGELNAEPLITKLGQTEAERSTVQAEKLVLTPTPIFLTR